MSLRSHLRSFAGVCTAAGAFVLSSAPSVHAQGTAFTYQGRLANGSAGVTGLYDFQFRTFDAASAGNTVGTTVNLTGVGVTNGLFTVTLDFGANAFTGPARFLDLAAKTNGSAAAFVPMTPRQPLTPAPYAIRAAAADSVATGSVGNAQLAASAVRQTNLVVTGTPGAGKVIGSDGTGLVWADAPTANGVWGLTGNAGTAAGPQFIGTTDNQPLEFKVNGTRALRIEPNASKGAPNMIGGGPFNWASNAVVGATIAGGGATNRYGYQYTNAVGADFGTVGGGAGNFAGGPWSPTVAGGFNNIALGHGSTVGGGSGNRAYSSESTVGGGDDNVATNTYATVAGGTQNQAIGVGSFVGGGGGNQAVGGVSTISGGGQNQATADYSTVGGGLFNASSGDYSAIGGGRNNTARGTNSGIFSGLFNAIEDHADNAVIGGGSENAIDGIGFYQANYIPGFPLPFYSIGSVTASNSVIAGGRKNQLIGPGSVISGGEYNLGSSDSYMVISGGFSNQILGSTYPAIFGPTIASTYATIGGGVGNAIVGSVGGVIGGGSFNTLLGRSATIPGGDWNVATNNSLAAGHRAKAYHSGSFVWADSQEGDFESSSEKQFLIRAQGGVGINANNPLTTLDVGGSFRMNSGTAFTNLLAGQFQLGAGSTSSRTNVTIQFPKAFLRTPRIVATIAADPSWDVDDTFVVSVRKTTTTSCVVNILRVDSPAGWSQSLRVNWIAWE